MNTVDFFSKYLLEKLGDKFWVSTLIPSVTFVLAAAIVFDPLTHVSSLMSVQGTLAERLSILLGLIIVPSLIIGFTLYTVQTYILQFYEGYIFFHRFPFLRNSQIRKSNKMLERIEALKKQINKLQSKNHLSDAAIRKFLTLRSQYYLVAAEYDRSFPYSSDLILPTRLGNILRASETYPTARYGMDATSWWPRLLNLIPVETKQGIENALNELYISLNFSVLSSCFYLLCVSAILYESIAPDTINPQSMLRYIFAGLYAILFTGFFYRISLDKAHSLGNQIRSVYDFYRLKILEQMKIKLPKNMTEEFDLWKNLGEFIVLRDFSLDLSPFDYDRQLPFDHDEQPKKRKQLRRKR